MIIHSDISDTFLHGNACFTWSINGIKVGEGGSVTVRTARYGDFSVTVSAQDCLPQTSSVLASLEGVGQQYETHVTVAS